MRTELKEGAWVEYQADWLAADIANDLFSNLLRDEEWVQLPIIANGKSVMQPRMMTWGGELCLIGLQFGRGKYFRWRVFTCGSFANFFTEPFGERSLH